MAFYIQAKHQRSTLRYSGFGVSFLDGANPNIKNVKEMCQAIADVLHQKYPEAYAKLQNNLEIEFYPMNGVMSITSSPGGLGPHVGGTADAKKVPIFGDQLYYALAWESLPGDGALIRTAGETDIFHEVAEHILPYVLSGDWNVNHKVMWTLVTQEMKDRYYQILWGVK